MARQLTVHAQQASKNKAHLILASRVELTTEIVGLDVDERLVHETRDHPVLVRLQELGAGNGALLHDTGAVTLLRAPCDLLTLRVGDERVLLGGSPEAEVWACDLVGVKASIWNFLTIKAVQEGRLAERILALRGGVAQVVAVLRATDEVRVGVDLVRLKDA